MIIVLSTTKFADVLKLVVGDTITCGNNAFALTDKDRTKRFGVKNFVLPSFSISYLTVQGQDMEMGHTKQFMQKI